MNNQSDFRPIPSLDNQFVINEFGEVYKIVGDKPFVDYLKIKPTALKRKGLVGYSVINAKFNGIQKMAPVHRLVAEVFMQDFNPSQQVKHSDGDKTNNHISNLYQSGWIRTY